MERNLLEKSIVIDLEMCRIGKEYRKKEFPHRHEIIQIGAVKLDEEGNIIDEFNDYVHPVYGRVDHFIQELTGIHEKMLTNAPLLPEVLQKLMDWAGSDCKIIYEWSATDRSQLIHEIDSKHIQFPGLKEFMHKDHWVNYQKVFGKRFHISWAMGLSQALEKAGLETEGHVHNGLDDAYNTAKLISKLEMNPNFEFPVLDFTSDETQISGFSMAECFSPELLSSLDS